MKYRLRRYFKIRIVKRPLLILVAVTLLTAFIFGVKIYNSIFPSNGLLLLKNQTNSDVSLIISKTIDNYMEKHSKETTALLSPIVDINGNISAYNANATYLEKTRFEITDEIINELEKYGKVKTKIKLGSISNNRYFSGKGLNLTITGDVITTVTSDVFTEIESLGINQAIYRVKILVRVDSNILVGGDFESFTVTNEHILAEKLIFGEVPLT